MSPLRLRSQPDPAVADTVNIGVTFTKPVAIPAVVLTGKFP
jgi:hypothetical protein